MPIYVNLFHSVFLVKEEVSVLHVDVGGEKKQIIPEKTHTISQGLK